ncbi:MAG: ABC transporter ATP-binding protein/permease [Candidatus Thermoplasmatota archaeon]|jgi:ATP-binding cassette subfamily B protein|nr:ABC transporter ATP-binding protein/permease [Candidatus Thermoplasmatota archaeon]
MIYTRELTDLPLDYDDQEDQLIRTGKSLPSFSRLLRDMFRMRRESTEVIIAVMITAVAGTLYPLSLGYAINSVIRRDYTGLYLFASGFFLLYVVQFFSNWLRTVSSTKLAQSTIKSLRDRSFQNLQHVPVSFFSKVKTGYLISRITNDAETLSEFLTFQLPQVVSGITTVLVSISIMFYKDFSLTLYALIVIPVLAGFTFSIQGRVRLNYLKTRKTIAAITGNLSENINAVRTIKAFNVEQRIQGNFNELNVKNFEANMKASKLSSLYGTVIRIIESLGIAVVIIAGSMQLQSGVTTVGILVAFVIYVQEFFDPVVQLSQLYNSYQSAMVGVSRIYGIIDSPVETMPGGTGRKREFRDSIELSDVSFSYGTDQALNGIGIRIARGEKVGIVGHTGAGKTTLSNLILKFYSPTNGSVTLDGVSMDEINTEDYRKLIAPVLQDPFMFRGTVYENIRFADSTVSRETVDDMARKFGLSEIFAGLPDGLNTNVGEMGRNLSEGQRQAISILRAFVRNPEILILDEPTSQIDPDSEKLIIASLREYLKDKTLILITHRFSMISLVNRIVVLQEGGLVEDGTFGELLDRKGIFSELYRIQYGPVDRYPI